MANNKLTTCLWFDGKAEEAANFYVSVFKKSTVSPRLRRLGVRDGFPRLPDVDITLHVPSHAASRRTDAFADHLMRSLRPQPAA